MGERTGISWTDATWNPWYGCTKVSPGCAHCYMFREQERYGGEPEVVKRSKTKFRDPLTWTEPKKVFTCSWSDWFHENADAWRDEAWAIIRATPQHTYQILTKRPERIAAHLPADWGEGYENAWLGVSVENQRWTTRIPLLLDIPARIRFLSCEPLLGPVDLTPLLIQHYAPERQIHWVIVGGESGVECRPMDLNWAREIRDVCATAGVAFHLKQLGGNPDPRAHDKALLDGRTHVVFPQSVVSQ